MAHNKKNRNLPGYVPGTVASKDKKKALMEDFHPLSLRQVEFLTAYSKTMDIKQAGKDIGLTAEKTRNLVKSEYVKQEMKAIYEIFKDKWKMTATMTAGKHTRLLEKFEAAFDKGEISVANALARMSSDSLKASGHFDGADGPKAANVQVNIQIGGSSKEELPEIEVVVEND